MPRWMPLGIQFGLLREGIDTGTPPCLPTILLLVVVAILTLDSLLVTVSRLSPFLTCSSLGLLLLTRCVMANLRG